MNLALRALFSSVALATFAACGDAGAVADADGSATGADSAGASGSSSSVNLPVVAEAVTDGDLVLSINTTGQVRSDAEGRLRAEVGGSPRISGVGSRR